MSTTVKDLFKVLSDEFTSFILTCGNLNVYNDQGDWKASFNAAFFGTKGIEENKPYYREGHEPKRVLLTAEDLKERALSGETMYIIDGEVNRYIFVFNKNAIWFVHNDKVDLRSYKWLSNKTWLDGTPCSKEG